MKKKILIISTVVGVLMVSLGVFFNAKFVGVDDLSNTQCEERGLKVKKGGSLYDCEPSIRVISDGYCVVRGQHTTVTTARECPNQKGSVRYLKNRDDLDACLSLGIDACLNGD